MPDKTTKSMTGARSESYERLDQSVSKLGSNRLAQKLAYFGWFPAYLKQRLTRRSPRGPIHVIFAIADHFEPAIVPGDGSAHASYNEQERKLECWCRDYPRAVAHWRDAEGFPLRHTYFYPAEQYDRDLVSRLAEHCSSGWGEIEIHLHHGMGRPDTAENTRRQLVHFRDTLAFKHGCLAYEGESETPRYAFVHGNFALANSAGGYGCGVDCETQILAETRCYADLTMPASAFHPAQITKINSLYECGLPLRQRAPHRRGGTSDGDYRLACFRSCSRDRLCSISTGLRVPVWGDLKMQR